MFDDDVPYILGHSPVEIRRLMLQAAILRPITERLLREAGITPGLRVLDVGCGAGDVAMLAAELVGPNGTVVGIDRSAEVLAVARERIQAAGHANIEFRESAVEDFVDRAPFDLAIGRYVLVHQGNPAAFIRSAASHVRRGGIIAFHEMGIYGECPVLPPVLLWEQTWRAVRAALSSVMVHPDAGGRLIAHFHDAGLKQPKMLCEIPVDGGLDSPIYAWLALALRSLLPQVEKIGAATAAEIDIDTLEERLRNAVTGVHGEALCPMQFCGWTKV
jgi:SAM-dependent methyltransferase